MKSFVLYQHSLHSLNGIKLLKKAFKLKRVIVSNKEIEKLWGAWSETRSASWLRMPEYLGEAEQTIEIMKDEGFIEIINLHY